MVQNLDDHYLRGHCFSYITLAKVQTQGFNIKESKFEESKPKELKPAESKIPASPCSKSIKPEKTFYIDKKKEYFKKKWDQRNNTLETKNNANLIESNEKKQNN